MNALTTQNSVVNANLFQQQKTTSSMLLETDSLPIMSLRKPTIPPSISLFGIGSGISFRHQLPCLGPQASDIRCYYSSNNIAK